MAVNAIRRTLSLPVVDGPRLRRGQALDLSRAEQRVVELLRQGFDNRTIAARLHISVRTVESHLSNIYRRAGVTSRTSLVTRLERVNEIP